MVPGGRALAARAHSEGHWIANHSFTHTVPLGEKPDAEYARREIVETQNLIGELAHPDKLFRPMGGGGVIGPHLLSRAALQILSAGKFTCVLWSSVPGDWKDQEGWVERCILEVGRLDWPVVAIHDVENAALPRLPEFLDRLEVTGRRIPPGFPGGRRDNEARRARFRAHCADHEVNVRPLPIASAKGFQYRCRGRQPLFRSVIGHFVLDDLSALHYEFDALKLGDVG